MTRLRIVAAGDTVQAQAQARGKLFETLMAEVLRHHGYHIDRVPNRNYAGMEIDIEGRHFISQTPLYAECKCYEAEVDSPKLQQFIGKYIPQWFKDNRCHGVFIALPSLNSHAKAYYNEYLEKQPQVTVRLLEEEQCIDAIYQSHKVARPEQLAAALSPEMGVAGDHTLLFADQGFFWLQYVIPPGGGIATRIAFFDSSGKCLSDRPTIDYLVKLLPELRAFEQVPFDGPPPLQMLAAAPQAEEIVEVRGSSSCFEYQFPASPQHFIGRNAVIAELEALSAAIVARQTSARGILFEANSGMGKSSVVLASVQRLRDLGHYAFAIDCRSASSAQFMLRVANHVLGRCADLGALPSEGDTVRMISGFDGAVGAMLRAGQSLRTQGKLLFVFFDQFENLFFLHDALKRITDLLLKICDVQTNIVLGFSWKTDLVSLTSDFPYQARDLIRNSSKHIILDTFSELETKSMLDRLEHELHQTLRKDLRFFLSEFSQGYPWLLKKLCAHVEAQRERGVQQHEMAHRLLKVEELFQEDLSGLSTLEENALRKIAKVAPIGAQELGDEFPPEVVQSLVNARLLVRIGPKLDVYWDIFRDYLNAGHVPVQENYILGQAVPTVIKATKLLVDAGGDLEASEFQARTQRSGGSFHNLARDLRLLGLVTLENGRATAHRNLAKDGKEFTSSVRPHVRDRLSRNRLVSSLCDLLQSSGPQTIDEMAVRMAGWCPYVSATERTWRRYARTMADWMDFSELATFDTYGLILSGRGPSDEGSSRDILVLKHRSNRTIPSVQYGPIEAAALRIVAAMDRNTEVDWTDVPRKTVEKSLQALRNLEFASGTGARIQLSPSGLGFAAEPENRPRLFAAATMNIASFAAFVEILDEHKTKGRTLNELAAELRAKLGLSWTDETAKTNVKIMLDWARHAKIAPGIFALSSRRSVSSRTRVADGQMEFSFNTQDL